MKGDFQGCIRDWKVIRTGRRGNRGYVNQRVHSSPYARQTRLRDELYSAYNKQYCIIYLQFVE